MLITHYPTQIQREELSLSLQQFKQALKAMRVIFFEKCEECQCEQNSNYLEHIRDLSIAVEVFRRNKDIEKVLRTLA